MKQEEKNILSASEIIESLGRIAGILIADIDGNMRDANDEYLRIIGANRKDFQNGKVRWDRITSPENLISDHQAIQQALQKGHCTPYEKVYIRPDGTRVPVLLAFATSKHVDDVFVCIIIDRSYLQRAEEGVKIALKASHTGIFDWNLLTGDLVWSEETREIFELLPSDPNPSYDLFLRTIVPEDRARVNDAVQETLETDKEYRVEYRFKRSDGSTGWVLATGLAFRDHQGKPVRMSGVVIDISEQKRIEARLRESEAALKESVKMREEFISIASHELRTPLTSIMLQADFLERLRKMKGMAGLNLGMLQTFLDLILHQGKRLNRLISDLLDASRMMNRKLVLTQAQVNLAKVIESAVTSVRKSASESGSSVKLELDHSIFGVCDSYRIEQVVENLLTNAIKYGGGHPIEVALDRPDSNRIRIRVKDYGIGIPTEMQSKIFDRFERGGATISFAGLGLGLYIAREIVTAHQGTIRVESQPGHGALFIVEIPVNPI